MKRMYIVKVTDKWEYKFDDWETAMAYCSELDFHGHEFTVQAYNVEE